MPLKLYDATDERIVGWQLLYGMTLDEQHWKVLQASWCGVGHRTWGWTTHYGKEYEDEKDGHEGD